MGDKARGRPKGRPDRIHARPSTIKRIKTFWCGFCRKKVTEDEVVKRPVQHQKTVVRQCPTCGGVLLGNEPGGTRRIFTNPMY